MQNEAGEKCLFEGHILKEKLRGILDWRSGNKVSSGKEQIYLPSHKNLEWTIREGLRTPGTPRVPMRQYGKDVTKDVLEEKRIRDQKPEKRKRKQKEVIKTGRKYRVPRMGKIDWKGYFYQLAVDKPHLNPIAYWSTKKKKYRYAWSRVAMMGNLHSVYGATRLSLAIQKIVNKALGIPAYIYIDDTIVLARSSWLMREYVKIVEDFYKFIGFELSPKTETMTKKKRNKHLRTNL